MNDRLKAASKVVLQGVLWVFILSIRVDGRPAFYAANDILVQNPLVRTVDAGLNDAWHRLQRAAAVAFAKTAPEETHAL